MKTTPKCYILVGVPGSGKSTWIAMQDFDQSKTVVVSTDNYIEKMAKKNKTTYNAMFQLHIADATKQMGKDVVAAVAAGKDIVWDQTSTTASTRAKKMRSLPSHYEKIAVVFYTPDAEEHARRLGGRVGKVIPAHILKSMQDNFVMPSVKEGFNEVRIAP